MTFKESDLYCSITLAIAAQSIPDQAMNLSYFKQSLRVNRAAEILEKFL
jgi:hypothetical protein